MTEITTSQILDAIERDKQKIIAELPEAERKRDEALKALFAAGEAQSKAWALVEKKSGKSGRFDACPIEVMKEAKKTDKAYTTADKTYTSYDVRVRYLKERLEKLERPEELDDRREKKQRFVKLKEMTAKPTAASQGFPEVYLAENGNFKSGFDSKAKSDLKAFLNNTPKPEALYKFKSREKAWALVEARGWEKFMKPANPERIAA